MAKYVLNMSFEIDNSDILSDRYHQGAMYVLGAKSSDELMARVSEQVVSGVKNVLSKYSYVSFLGAEVGLKNEREEAKPLELSVSDKTRKEIYDNVDLISFEKDTFIKKIIVPNVYGLKPFQDKLELSQEMIVIDSEMGNKYLIIYEVEGKEEVMEGEYEWQ